VRGMDLGKNPRSIARYVKGATHGLDQESAFDRALREAARMHPHPTHATIDDSGVGMHSVSDDACNGWATSSMRRPWIPAFGEDDGRCRRG
jgi:hypothetical protein